MHATLSDMDKGVFKASITLFGTIVGAGIFGLPYVVQQAGYPVGLFWLVFLAAAVTCTHLLYGEIVSVTPGEHRLVGYVGEYLGPWAKRVETVASCLGLFGGALAYLIIGSLFLKQLLAPFFPSLGESLFVLPIVAIGVGAVVFGVRFLETVDVPLMIAKLGAFLLLIIWALPEVRLANLTQVSLPQAFLPYGVVLFSLGGLTAVTEIRSMVAGDARRLRRAITIGTLMAAGLTTLFVTVVVGALGPGTTEESVAGMNARYGGLMPFIAAAAGFLAVTTAYAVFTEYAKSLFNKDFGWPSVLAALAAVGVPFGLYLAGIRSFGRILELIGTTLIGVEGVFIILMYFAACKKYPQCRMRMSRWPLYGLIAVYAAGAVYEVGFRILAGH